MACDLERDIMKAIFVATLLLTLVAARPLAADVAKFHGTWEVDVDRTMLEVKKSPKYTPEDAERLPAVVKRMMATLRIRVTDKTITYLQGSEEMSVPFRVERSTETSAVLVLSQGGKDFTLTLSLREGKYMNVKSTASDDLDYYIWKRAS
jgi:hypothetical protein